MNQRNRLILILIFSIISGCGKQIEDFVTADPRKDLDGKNPVSTSSANSNAMKMSPASQNFIGSQVKTRSTLTVTNQLAQGSQIKSRYSFHQNRPNF